VSTIAYRCERCGASREAATPFDADKPDGYFIKVERVTNHQHARSKEIFLCEKDCLLGFVRYGISGATTPWAPIGRVPE
jgi:hypothetical protein